MPKLDGPPEPGTSTVYYGVDDLGNVVVTNADVIAMTAFVDAVFACRSVADVRHLAAREPELMSEAIEYIDELELTPSDPWDVESMPGYGDGDWPPRYDIGMAELFTEEQVSTLERECEARLVDTMGGSGEALMIPALHVERVATLLQQWGYDAVRIDDFS